MLTPPPVSLSLKMPFEFCMGKLCVYHHNGNVAALYHTTNRKSYRTAREGWACRYSSGIAHTPMHKTQFNYKLIESEYRVVFCLNGKPPLKALCCGIVINGSLINYRKFGDVCPYVYNSAMGWMGVFCVCLCLSVWLKCIADESSGCAKQVELWMKFVVCCVQLASHFSREMPVRNKLRHLHQCCLVFSIHNR